MRIVGVSLTDGLVSLITRYSDGLHLSFLGLDPRGSDSVGLVVSATPPGAVATVLVTPSPARLPTGPATFEFTAIGFDAEGQVVEITPVWSIVEGAPFASIDADTGILTTGTSGEVEEITVRATVGSVTGDADVIIEDVVLDRIETNTSQWNMLVGTTVQFSAVGYDGDENVIAVTPVWSKVSGVGSINASTGVYTPGTVPGVAVLRATVGAETDDIAITVTAGEVVTLTITPASPEIVGGESEALTVTGYDTYGNVAAFDGSFIDWACSAGGFVVGTYSTATLYVIASETTQFFPNAISVTYGGITAYNSFTVTPGDGGEEA